MNYDCLPGEIKTLIEGLEINLPILDVRRSIIARSIEIAYAIYEAVRIIKNYEIEKVPHQEREAQPYYSKDVHYMITETPWKCVSNEFLKFTKSDDFIDQYNSDQNRLVEFALRGTYQ